MGNIIGDLRVLSDKCNRDVDRKYPFNYEYYLKELNRVIAELGQIQPEIVVDIGLIEDAKIKSLVSGSMTGEQDAKLREISAIADKLLSRLSRSIEENVPQNEPRNTSLDRIFDAMQFHPRVVQVSETLFKTGHYASAIFEAFKAVDNFVKEKTTLSLNGQALMSKVFDETTPIIKLNDLLTQSDRDEQEGFKFLFKGATIGIRNPKAHDNVVQTDTHRTLEYLGFASLLMRRIEEGKLVKLSMMKEQKS